MTLSALIRKRDNATATVATPATHEGLKPTYSDYKNPCPTFATHEGLKAGTVANVASVAVANQLLAEEETAVRVWLAHIEETDPATINEVLIQCQYNADARHWFLERQKEVPPEPMPDYSCTCCDCRHFQRIDHPNLGHCTQGEPESPAGIWDTDRRWCMKHEAIEHG